MQLKKPKFWDKKKPNLISYLLLPFTSIIKLNNLWQSFALPKKSNLIKSICVGNIYVGGTGKTPTTIKLFKILKKLKIKVAVGKKFYPSQKDEIKILKNYTNLLISNNRKNIIKKAKELKQEMVVFDDGLQDNSIYYDIKIVCFDYQNWIGNGQLIPAGPLREKIDSLNKYDCVFLKDTDSNKIDIITKEIKKINHNIKIFCTYLEISNLKQINKFNKIIIFSGIGNPNNFKRILQKNNFNIIEEIIYPDHYDYKKNDIIEIKKKAKKIGANIITTEKDFIKLSDKEKKNINFLKVNLKIKNEKNFINFLKLKIHEKY
jgi:tetraacyldisaccharide 4'-kinase